MLGATFHRFLLSSVGEDGGGSAAACVPLADGCHRRIGEVDFAWELVAGSASPSVVAASVGLVFSGCGGGCGCCGSEEDGSSSSFPWRRLSSVASLDPWPRELGVRPRPMLFRRCPQLVHGGERLLRFVKAFVRWGSRRPRVRQRRPEPALSDSGGQRVQGPGCNFYFLRGPFY